MENTPIKLQNEKKQLDNNIDNSHLHIIILVCEKSGYIFSPLYTRKFLEVLTKYLRYV